METIKARLLTMEALGVVCCKKADDDFLPPPNKVCNGQPALLFLLWRHQHSKIWPCEHLVSAARPSPASKAALLFHSSLLLQQKERGRFSLMRQLLIDRCELVPGVGGATRSSPKLPTQSLRRNVVESQRVVRLSPAAYLPVGL